MLRAAGEAPRDGGFLDRLQANAEKLVRIRPVDEEPRGDDRGAILARIEQRAAQGNISGALAELAKLPRRCPRAVRRPGSPRPRRATRPSTPAGGSPPTRSPR